MARENITFKCSVCGEENYIGTRNKRKHTEKFRESEDFDGGIYLCVYKHHCLYT